MNETPNAPVDPAGAPAAQDAPETTPPAPETSAADELAKLRREYADLQEKFGTLRRRRLLEQVCRETGCTDPDYLEFRAGRQAVDLEDAAALKDFAGRLAASAPGCFSARIIPGSSAGATAPAASADGVPAEAFSGDRIGKIALSVSAAPDADRR